MALLIWGYFNVILIPINHLMRVSGHDSENAIKSNWFYLMLFNWSFLAMYVHVVVTPMKDDFSLDWHGAQLEDIQQVLYYRLHTLTITHIFME